MQRDARPRWWERVSFPRATLVHIYNKDWLSMCSHCFRLHRYACVLKEISGLALEHALAISLAGLALYAHPGYVYLVSWRQDAPIYGDLYHGLLFRYSVEDTLGLQRNEHVQFVHMEQCRRFLSEQGVPFHQGRMPAEKRPSILL
jgi:hypothetical protein